MRLLLDSHVLIALARQEARLIPARVRDAIFGVQNISFASAASLWEIAIKTRIGKLDPLRPLDELPAYFEAAGLVHLAIDYRHAVAEVEPLPATHDPFDRLLLAQCTVEGLQLVTTDRELSQHPLAWRS